MSCDTKNIKFIIDHNVAPPIPRVKLKLPFDNMKVNDSFSFPFSIRNKIASSACFYGKKHNKEFITKKISNFEGRVWRIK